MIQLMKISCIIPAYNEEKSIQTTLRLLLPLLSQTLYEIIVINDYSTDKTWSILDTFPPKENLHIHHNLKNLGKSGTVARGIQLAKGDYILLLDADLLNLSQQNIIDLISPIQTQKSKSSIAFIKNSRPLRPFKKIDYCNGQRILPTPLLKQYQQEISNLRSYWLEVFLNKIQIKHKLSLSSILRTNVENDFHHQREWFFQGRKRNLKIWRHIISCAGGLFAIYKMNYDLEKLLKK